MKKILFILVCLILFSNTEMFGQEYSAINYWKMERDPEYARLLKKQTAGELLSTEEQTYMFEQKAKLANYFEKLSDGEKSVYYQNRKMWSENPESLGKTVNPQEAEVYSGERSMYSQYLISSGLFGFMYGLSTAAIFEMDEAGAAALPLLAAGASALAPVLTIKDRNVSYNSLALSLHGKSVGAMQGAAFSFLLSGNNLEEGKLVLGLSTLSSIVLGRVGYNLGRDKDWSRGKVALYSHYGLMMPFEGMALAMAFESEDARVYGGASLLFGAGGYLMADRISRKYDYTLGDVRATTTLSSLNTFLGFFIMSDISEYNGSAPSIVLLPAAGALGGTLLGHVWLKDAKLTNQQGRNVALATTGGSVMGLGLMALFTPESITPYYITGYLAGISMYAVMVEKYKKANRMSLSNNDEEKRWDISFMPQNILVNRQIAPYALSHPEKRVTFLPAFSASVKF
jgi:hypothetical protein